jgi:hypothetical protein
MVRFGLFIGSIGPIKEKMIEKEDNLHLLISFLVQIQYRMIRI